MHTDGRTDGQKDGETDRKTASTASTGSIDRPVSQLERQSEQTRDRETGSGQTGARQTDRDSH